MDLQDDGEYIGEWVGHLSPHVFISYWHTKALRELAQAQQPSATSAQQGSLPFIPDRLALYAWLEPIVTEAELVDALERAVAGNGPTIGVRLYGVVEKEAKVLLAEWRHPDRDSRETYT